MRKPRLPVPTAILLSAILLSNPAAPLQAQIVHGDWYTHPWVGDLTFLGANALSSGVSAGLIQTLRGGSFTDGFTRGAMGGSLHYAGMRISARPFAGAGLMGRQVAAVGGAIVRNAGEARPSFERLMLPLGPLHLHVRTDHGVSVRPKLNFAATIVAVSAVAESRLKWDPGATLSAGAPVFRAPDRAILDGDGDRLGGVVRSGIIFLSDLGSGEADRHVFAHERAHVLQHDWRFQVWSDPAERWLLSKVPGGATLYDFVDLDFVATYARGAVIGVLDIHHGDRLSEIEAEFLADR